MATLKLEIDFGDDYEAALCMYANLIGLSRYELGNDSPGFSFSGTVVPCSFTGFRKAYVDVIPDVRLKDKP